MPERIIGLITCVHPQTQNFAPYRGSTHFTYYPAGLYIYGRAGVQGATTHLRVRGHLAQGPLILGQRPVTHAGFSGDATFDCLAMPSVLETRTFRIGTSLTFGVAGSWDNSQEVGIANSAGQRLVPSYRYFAVNPAGVALAAFAYSEPHNKSVHPKFGLMGETGYSYSDLSLTPGSISYTVDDRSWYATLNMNETYINYANGHRRRWLVTVEWNGTHFVGTSVTTSNLRVSAVGGQLVWNSESALSQNFTTRSGGVVSSSANGSSMVNAMNFKAECERQAYWAATQTFPGETAISFNEALNEYRALHSNNIENALQWRKLEKLLPLRAATLMQSLPPSGRRRAILWSKIVANIYLWWRYVVKTTYRDLKELVNAIPSLVPKPGKVKLHGACRDISREHVHPNVTWVTTTCVVDAFNIALLPMRWGIHPGLAQAWDIIPLSFVVDWVYNVSEQLAAIDWFMYRAFLRLHYMCVGRKTVVTIDASAFGGVGEITMSYYIRSVGTVYPPFAESVPPPRGVPIKNWAPAAAALAISLR